MGVTKTTFCLPNGFQQPNPCGLSWKRRTKLIVVTQKIHKNPKWLYLHARTEECKSGSVQKLKSEEIPLFTNLLSKSDEARQFSFGSKSGLWFNLSIQILFKASLTSIALQESTLLRALYPSSPLK